MSNTNTNTSVKIVKVDPDRNLVFGWAYVAVEKNGQRVVDASDEVIEPEELEDAAYLFNLLFRGSGVMHKGEVVGALVESLAITKEKLEHLGLPPDALPQGWWVGFYVECDEVFDGVKKGIFPMFSIQGKAIREVVA